MSIGKNLKIRREKVGLTQTQIAKKIKTNKNTYCDYENDKLFPTYLILEKIADVFNTSMEFLLGLSCSLCSVQLSADDELYMWLYKYFSIKINDVCYRQFCSLQSMAKHIFNNIGNKPLKSLLIPDINSFYLAVYRQSNLSKKSFMYIKQVLNETYELAIDCRSYDYDPIPNSRFPHDAQRRQETKIISEETRKQIIEFEHPMQLSAMIMLFAGLRRGELLALRWSDINLNSGTIRVDKAVERAKNKTIVKNMPKTEAGIRNIDIPKILRDFLTDYKSKYHITDDKLVLSSSTGNYCSDGVYNKLWKNYIIDMNYQYGDFSDMDKDSCEKSKLPLRIEYFSSKQLRHYFCTLMFKADISPAVAQKQLGHSRVSTTYDYYLHFDKIFVKNSMKKLDEYLERANQYEQLSFFK